MKLNRKWIMVLALVMSMAMATGGTLAYLTDRDSEANVFTMGNVEIDLNEEFDPEDAELIPGNKVDKVVTVTNTGKTDAWVWYTITYPKALDLTESGKTILWTGFTTENHDNAGYEGYNDGEDEWLIEYTGEPYLRYFTDENGVDMVEFTVLYQKPLAVGETTPTSLEKVWLDQHIDIDPDGNMARVENGVVEAIDYNIKDAGKDKPVVYVSAYAIQTEGFATVQAAYAAYNTQWGSNGTEYGDPDDVIDSDIPVIPDVTVDSSEALAEAITEGNTVIAMSEGTYRMPVAAKGKTLTLVGAGADKTTIEVVPAGQGEANGQLDYSLDGSTVTFTDLTIKTNSQTYAGYARMSGTYNNCTIQNTYNLGLNTENVFNDCTFNISNEYLRVNGAKSATFNNCVFNTEGRAILVFQDGTSIAQTVTVKDCTFNASAPAYTWNGIHVAAVSIDSTQGVSYEVNFDGNNTVGTNFAGLVQIKTESKPITINGATATDLTYKQ